MMVDICRKQSTLWNLCCSTYHLTFTLTLGWKGVAQNQENFTFWSSVSCTKKRQFYVRSWMDVLVPFVCTTEPADYCYLQEHASTKQVVELSAFSWKCSHYLIAVFVAARAEGMNFRSTECFIDQFFPVHGTLWVRSTPSSFSTMDSSTGPPSLFVSTTESSVAWFLSLCEWRRPAAILHGWIFKLFESSCSDKVCHSGPLSAPLSQAQWLTLQHLQPS